MSRRIILASRNKHKIKEILSLLSETQFEFESLIDHPEIPEIPETGSTLEENALIKARTTYRYLLIPSISDDSGLEVDSLGGDPGVRSARYAGDDATYGDNNHKLLKALHGKVGEDRRARFRCVAAYVDAKIEHVCEGICRGTITDQAAGDFGFGYDPIFIPEGASRTLAQFILEEKNQISHRSRAIREMKSFLLRQGDRGSFRLSAK